MLRSKNSPHSFAFGLIVAVSLALYPAAQGNHPTIMCTLLSFISMAAIIILLTES